MAEKIAVVFPGQGSQYKGMLSALGHTQATQQLYAEACDILGIDIVRLCEHDSDGLLNMTEYTQPALLVAGVAAWLQLQDKVKLSFLAGHSLGEYTALVCSGALSFADGLRLVRLRGQLMQAAVPVGVGSMAAILGKSQEQVMAYCEQARATTAAIVSPANLNAPGQIVIAGTTAAVECALELAKADGAKRAILLPVSVPSHCALMQPAADKFAIELEKTHWNDISIPIIQNYSVRASLDKDVIVNALKLQLFNPVRWIETIEYFESQNVHKIIECGPGRVLTSLNKRIANNVICETFSETLAG